MIEVNYRGYTIYVGENAKENDEIIQKSSPNDIWAHISNFPSAHGVICNPSEKRVPQTILKRVCCIIKSKSSKCKSMNQLGFDICKIKDVERTNTPGLVNISNVKNIII